MRSEALLRHMNLIQTQGPFGFLADLRTKVVTAAPQQLSPETSSTFSTIKYDLRQLQLQLPKESTTFRKLSPEVVT